MMLNDAPGSSHRQVHASVMLGRTCLSIAVKRAYDDAYPTQ
jgi:hypothetical protein